VDGSFLCAGLDYVHPRFQLGLLGGYATAGETEWQAGLVAVNAGLRAWALFELTGSGLLSLDETLWQIEARATLPLHRSLQLWAGLNLTIDERGEVEPAAQLGLHLLARNDLSLGLWGQYGTTQGQLVYRIPALYDQAEEMTFAFGATGSVPVLDSQSVDIAALLGFDVTGTRSFGPLGEEIEGILTTKYFGLSLTWGQEASGERSEP